MRTTSVSVSSRRSPAACARRCTSSAATRPAGQVVLGGSNGDARRDGCDRLVADVLVDEVAGLPQRCGVDAGLAPEAVERVDERLAGDAVERQCQRIDRGRDQVGADPRRDDRVEQARSGGTLNEEADRQARLLADALDELLGEVRQQRIGRVVEDDARRSQRGQLLRALDERVDLALAAGAVDEADVELLARREDRLTGLEQVRDVVERVVQPEDVDAVVGRARDEPPHDVGRDRARADEEPSAERQAERRRRACVDRANALPRALDGEPDGRVEDAATGDLEVREAGRIEDLRDAEHLARRELAGRADPARAGGWWCRRSGACQWWTLSWRGNPGERLTPRPRDAASPPMLTRARCSGLRAGRP